MPAVRRLAARPCSQHGLFQVPSNPQEGSLAMRVCPYCRQPLGQYCHGCGEPLQQKKGRVRLWCDKPACVRLRRQQHPQIGIERAQ
jgi:predicted amidophosphoribosyltransferase